MKKLFILLTFTVLFYFVFYIFPPFVKATCYTAPEPLYQTCLSGIGVEPGYRLCPNPPPTCCTSSNDLCPGEITPPTETPPPPLPGYTTLCNQFYITPNPGPDTSSFTINGEGCSSESVDQLSIRLFSDSGIGQLVFSSTVNVSNTPSSFSIPITASLTPGLYLADLRETSTGRYVYCQDVSDICNNLILAVTTSAPLECCDVNPNNCTIVNINTDKCPSECPMECGLSGICQCMRRTLSPPSSGGAEIFCVDNDPNERTSSADSGKIATALGCIPVDTPKAFIDYLLSWSFGIAGGIAFVLIIYAGFLIMTSAGDPRRLQAGKELLTAAIMGLLLLVFGFYLLRLIGVNILGILI